MAASAPSYPDSAPDRGSLDAAPAPLSRFIGRSAEIRAIVDLLADTRAVTLTGPGGSGKTRLALEVLKRLDAASHDSVWWIELAALEDGSLVAQHVAASLDLVVEQGRSPAAVLVTALRERTGVLALDNCEHVVDACAVLAERLLRACRGLRLLSTSREAIGMEGETAWLVPPLGVPAPGAGTADLLRGSEAAELFADRARAVAPAFRITDSNAAAVAGICRRLDGVPLAIELAAARVNVLSPAQILDRLGDCFSILVQRRRTGLPRHQTIRATLDWSYALLAPGERLLLERLSVFAGGFTLEAAERVCAGGDIEEWQVLDLIAALVERSLVTMHEHGGFARYNLLEIVRQYAAGKLKGEERAALEVAHAEFFAELADRAAPHIDLLQDPDALERVLSEHDNLRVAVDRSVRPGGSPDSALRIAAAFGPVAIYSLQWGEGRRWIDAALAAAASPRRDLLSARALRIGGSLAAVMHDHALARQRLEHAERIARELGDARELALVLCERAGSSLQDGEADVALMQAQEAGAHARAARDPWVLSSCLATGLGFVHAFRGDTLEADAVCAEAQSIAQARDHALGLLFTSFSRAMIAWMHEDFDGAEHHSRSAVAALARLGNRWYVGRALFVPAAVALHRGDAARAVRLLAACQTQYERVGGHLVAVEQPLFDGLVERARAALGAAQFAREWASGAGWSAAEALAQVRESAGNPVATALPEPPREAPSAGEIAMVVALPQAELEVPADRAIATAVALPPAELEVRVLGSLEIARNGERLGSEHWAYAKPRELLVYLLLMGDRGAAKEEIGRALWPDASPAQVRNNLHVTLHYVRKALGAADWIVYAGERYRIGPARSVAFDYDAFLERVESALPDGAAVDHTALEEALRLYRGDLLLDERFNAWHLPYRDRALATWLRAVFALAERAFARHEYAAALRLYQQVLAREDLNEDAHRRVMQCLARTGASGRSVQHYQRLEAMLRDELDTEPDPETRALAATLREGGLI